MVDYHLKQVFIFVVFNLFMTVKTQNSLDMCKFGLEDVDDGESGYLTYDRSTLYPDPMTISGTCVCVISAENRDPDTKIATIYETKICGTAGCTEQLLIDAGRRSYDSCTSDIGTAEGDCVNIPPSAVLSNPRPISDQESIKIQFSFATRASSEQVTDLFTLRIQVAATILNRKIHIECWPPSFTSPSSTSGTSTTETAETPHTSDTQTLQTSHVTSSNNLTTFSTITSGYSHSTDDMSEVPTETTPFQSDDQEYNIGLIVGVSVGSVCVVTGVILVIIFVKRGQSNKSPPKNGVDQNIYNEIPNPDSFSTELVDNAMYSSQTSNNQLSVNTTIVDNPQYGLQTPDMQSADTYIVDNTMYSSRQTHPGLYTSGTDLIENTSYVEANMNHIGHHSSEQQENVTYSDVENPSVNNGGFEGPYQNVTNGVYDGGSKLVDNVIYNNDPQMSESDVFYSGGTEIVDNTMYG